MKFLLRFEKDLEADTLTEALDKAEAYLLAGLPLRMYVIDEQGNKLTLRFY
mgnify:CR=1 FL=1